MRWCGCDVGEVVVSLGELGVCGIVGICRVESRRDIGLGSIQRMLGAIRHRGPDEAGVYLDDRIGLGQVRLSIIDLESGCQPIHNEDQTLWIVYNGEVFNYVELREELEGKGHTFYTTSDTEVVIHMYEEEGPACLGRLNGQFALGIWDSQRCELFLARDRVGIRPLHYTMHEGRLIFASEIKALFTIPEVRRELDPSSLDEVFTFWTVLPGRTAFRDVHELRPGHYLKVSRGKVETHAYWEIPVYSRGEQTRSSPEAICEQVEKLLLDAIRIRLRADVPVGCYLSGGLDSSGIAALVAQRFNANVKTFGIRFETEGFDEGVHQRKMVSFLGTEHREVQATASRIGERFSETLWHAEKPLVRTGPVPLLMLSGAVRQADLKVVLTGEGADEVFGGYNIFKEAKVRRFWARNPDSRGRAALLEHIYGYIFREPRMKRFLPSFFAKGRDGLDDPLFSHLLRWENTSRIKTFFSRALGAAIGETDPYERVRQSLPAGYGKLDTVGKAQYLEMMIFLSNYLLSSQGDRMAMAHSVEIRLPFLDYRLIDLMARVPSKWKILGLNEKHLLKKVLRSTVPDEIRTRQKQPYRAPIAPTLLGDGAGDLALEMLSPRAVARAGLFDSAKVERLVKKMQRLDHPGEMDNMALAGVLSTQMLHQRFVTAFPASLPEVRPRLIVDKRGCASRR